MWEDNLPAVEGSEEEDAETRRFLNTTIGSWFESATPNSAYGTPLDMDLGHRQPYEYAAGEMYHSDSNANIGNSLQLQGQAAVSDLVSSLTANASSIPQAPGAVFPHRTKHTWGLPYQIGTSIFESLDGRTA